MTFTLSEHNLLLNLEEANPNHVNFSEKVGLQFDYTRQCLELSCKFYFRQNEGDNQGKQLNETN